MAADDPEPYLINLKRPGLLDKPLVPGTWALPFFKICPAGRSTNKHLSDQHHSTTRTKIRDNEHDITLQTTALMATTLSTNQPALLRHTPSARC